MWVKVKVKMLKHAFVLTKRCKKSFNVSCLTELGMPFHFSIL